MSLLKVGRILLNDFGVNLFFLQAAAPTSVIPSRHYMRDFWARPTGTEKKHKPGHMQGKPWIFRNNKPSKLWLKNSGPSRPSYIEIRKKKSFDALFEHAHGREVLMQRIVRGDKKIGEF